MNAQYTINNVIQKRQLIWYGYVKKMFDNRIPKVLLERITSHRRKERRPKRLWKERIQKAMTDRNLQNQECHNRKKNRERVQRSNNERKPRTKSKRRCVYNSKETN